MTLLWLFTQSVFCPVVNQNANSFVSYPLSFQAIVTRVNEVRGDRDVNQQNFLSKL
ncbi:hypothetical protein C942_03059 [Photobacterium marinum]|uniref:Uncharacterized protein n=1 Tax=Photobacterium marinum TaxID=1056511 RepID=L8J523_9GAMM|nr:hypothetical protein C942_03059 [Photobacterium marinum]